MNFYLERRGRVDPLILAAMLALAAESIPATAREIAARVAKHGFWETPTKARRALRRLAIDGMVVEWGPLERPKGLRGANPSTWQLTAEGENVAMEDDQP